MPLVVILGLTIAGVHLWPMMIVIGALTFALMAVFEYSHKKSSSVSSVAPGEALVPILGVALLSSVAYEIGMFGWMAVMQLVLFPVGNLHPMEPAFWGLMQVGFVLGFLTGYPTVWWLMRRGAKEAM